MAALRRRAAVSRRGEPADEADLAGPGQQGRRPQARACQGYGRAYQGGGRRAPDSPGRADRGCPAARARHHQGTAAGWLRLGPPAGGGEAGAGLPIALAEQIEAARLLEHGITKERLPFVYGWYRLMVTAPSRELCVRRSEAVVEHYRDAGIDVVNSTGDQFSLLRESLPGDRVRLSSYVQRQPLYTIAGGMPTATVDLGDRSVQDAGWVGPYIGETLGRARSVVHFDPLVAAARNRPTAVAITGEPGGGKTTLALLLILQLALRGVTVAVIDPKGDAESLVSLLQARGRQARVLPLGSAAPGLLDPFSFGDELAERRTMATETLRLLLPRMSEERESAMIQAVGAVAAGDQPSLGKVIAHLENSGDPASVNLGAVLRSMSELRLGSGVFW